MSEFTNILGLEKPFQDEDYNVDVFNDNAQKLDDYMMPDRVPAEVTVKGRTLVNLLGRAGNFIYKNEDGMWIHNNAVVSYNCDEVVIENNTLANDTSAIAFNRPSIMVGGRYYIAVVEAMVVSGDCTARLRVNTPASGYDKDIERISSSTKYIPMWNAIKYQPVTDESNVSIGVNAIGICSFKNLRMYEITQAEYDALDTMTRDEIATKYPYVDAVKPIVNPYIESKENLLSLSDIYQIASVDLNEDIPITVSTGGGYVAAWIRVGTNTDISINIDGLDYNKYRTVVHLPNNVNGSPIYDNPDQYIDNSSFTINTKDRSNFILVIYMPILSVEGAKEILNDLYTGKVKISIVKGSIPKSYDDCHNSRIMFETKVYEGETITRQNDGTYVKNNKYHEDILLDCPLIFSNSYTGFKTIGYKYSITPNGGAQYFIRYDGKIVNFEGSLSKECFWFDGNENVRAVYMTIPNTLTGWGDSYTPTPDEIKAFFLGWKMYAGKVSDDRNTWSDDLTPTHIKSWLKLWCGVGSRGALQGGAYYIYNTHTTILPTTLNDQGYIPYKLIYKKATPTLEEIRVHGSLDISDDSVVNVNSGLVLGETARQMYTSGSSFINGAYNLLNHRADSFIQILTEYGGYINHSPYILSESAPIRGKMTTDLRTELDLGLLLVDYLIYKPDTVAAFDYTITTPEYLKETLNKTVEELSNTNEKLSNAERELVRTKYELSQRSNPNLLINGNFQVWQRGTEFTNLGNLVKYNSDRWHNHTNGSLFNISKLSKGLRLTKGSTSGDWSYIAQCIDKDMSDKLCGQYVTLSIKAKTYNKPALMSINKGFPTAHGTISDTVRLNEGVTKLTFKIPYDLGVSQLLICINSQYIPNGEFIDIEWVKLEVGEFATPFVPRTYAEELAMCERYYEIVSSTERVYAVAANYLRVMKAMRHKKRVAPTITESSFGVALLVQSYVTGFTISTNAVTTYNLSLQLDKTSHGLTDAYIDFTVFADAEIY